MNREIYRLSLNDATVRAFLHLHESTPNITYEEVLEKLVVALADEKKKYFDLVVHLTQLSTQVSYVMPIKKQGEVDG